MTSEARWRLQTARELDSKSISYLHVVPNTMTCFNSVTGVDDFEIAPMCDVWAATMNQSPSFTTQVTSAARGKVAYNVESHVNFGSLRMHQRMLGLNDLLADWLPQIGLGVKGFLFWQFRPEVTGTESPAWGLVKLDGTDRPITNAARAFWKTLAPHIQKLMKCPAPSGEIGIYKGRKNELFHFCADLDLHKLAGGVEAYLQSLYWMNYRFRYVSNHMLKRGNLEGIKLLVLPQSIYMSADEVRRLDAWVKEGGVVLCEAHTASYDATSGRHTRSVPGMGLAESWGIREIDSTSTHHLKVEQAGALNANLAPDELKALRDSGAVGGEFVPLRLTSGKTIWGGSRYALLDADGAETLASFDGRHPTIVMKRIGAGTVIYCGTNLGQGAKRDAAGLREILTIAANRAGVKPTLDAETSSPDVHVDLLEQDGAARFVTIWNRSDTEQPLKISHNSCLRGLFSGKTIEGASMTLPAKFIDLFVCTDD
jgi:beta-galactosidase